MARKCTCKICKNKGDTDTFYKVTNEKGINSYYCNQEEYENLINEKNKRKSLLEYIALEIFNYEEGQIIPPVMVKKIGELNKFYDYDVIKECFRLNKENIEYWIKVKDFSSEYGMVSYISKIIEGNINDVHNKWKYIQKQLQKENSNSVSVDMLNQAETITSTNNNTNDISMFLEEGDV